MKISSWVPVPLMLPLVISCSSLSAPQKLIGPILGSEYTKEDVAWSDLKRNSRSKPIVDGRYQIEAWGAPLSNPERIELRLLARAAAEALQNNYSHFAILHIRDRNLKMGSGIYNDAVFGADKVWIGTYEDFVASRYERDYAAAPRAWINPGLSATILMLRADDDRTPSAFEAGSLYENVARFKLP